MNQTQQEQQQQSSLQQSSRWLRIGILTLTTLGPIVTNLVERMRQRQQQRGSNMVEVEGIEVRQEAARNVQAEALRRLDDFTATSRRMAMEQAQQLQKQARQLREQARVLRKALRTEAEQRRELRKLVRRVQMTGADWSGEVLKRGEGLTGLIAAQSEKISQEVIEKSGELTQNLAERGQQLVQAGRSQDRRFWSVVGFSVGLFAAATTAFVVVRRRMVQQQSEEEEQIELTLQENWEPGANGRPAGEILVMDEQGVTPVAAEAVSIDVPEEAAYVGIISTKRYIPKELFREQAATGEAARDDLVYFHTEEEAQEQGFQREGA
jgi:hypothetical protein